MMVRLCVKKLRGERFKSERSDCTVVALSLATGVSYAKAHGLMQKAGRKNRGGLDDLSWRRFLDRAGAHTVPARTTIGKFVRDRPLGRFIVCVTPTYHAVAIIDGKVYNQYPLGPRRHVLFSWKL